MNFNRGVIAAIFANVEPLNDITAISRANEIENLFTIGNIRLSLGRMSCIDIGIDILCIKTFSHRTSSV